MTGETRKVAKSFRHSPSLSSRKKPISGKGLRRHSIPLNKPKRKILDPQRMGNYTLGEIREAIISSKAI